MSKKYAFRPIEISPGVVGTIDWFEDSEIEYELRRSGGKLISLTEASHMFYAALFDPQKGFSMEIHKQGLLGFARANGYRVDLFTDIVVFQSI